MDDVELTFVSFLNFLFLFVFFQCFYFCYGGTFFKIPVSQNPV